MNMTSTTKAVLWIVGIALVALAGFVFFASRGSDTEEEVSATSTATVACTMDAKMCPDGSYVGRSGPDCEFVCPAAGATNTGGTGVNGGAGISYPADLAK